MILTGQNRSTRRKFCPSTNFSTTNLGWTTPRLNPGLGGDRPATKRPNLSTAYEFSVRRYIGSSIREPKPRPIKYNADILAPTPRSWIHVFGSIRCEIQCDHVVYAACAGTSSIHPSIHLWRYSPFWALASLRRRLYSSLSSARPLRPRIPRICYVSRRMTSSHLALGFPSGLVLRNFQLRIFWGILSSSILMTQPAHPSFIILISSTKFISLCIL
jgi:hypothetical protein